MFALLIRRGFIFIYLCLKKGDDKALHGLASIGARNAWIGARFQFGVVAADTVELASPMNEVRVRALVGDVYRVFILFLYFQI